jgi:hypothetical protein
MYTLFWGFVPLLLREDHLVYFKAFTSDSTNAVSKFSQLKKSLLSILATHFFKAPHLAQHFTYHFYYFITILL